MIRITINSIIWKTEHDRDNITIPTTERNAIIQVQPHYKHYKSGFINHIVSQC